jgi:hypothetical protein
MTPTPSAPPPGSVFATAVDAWLTFIVCHTLLPGSADIITSQYVARFHSAASVSVVSSSQVIADTCSHTFEKSAIFGKA